MGSGSVKTGWVRGIGPSWIGLPNCVSGSQCFLLALTAKTRKKKKQHLYFRLGSQFHRQQPQQETDLLKSFLNLTYFLLVYSIHYPSNTSNLKSLTITKARNGDALSASLVLFFFDFWFHLRVIYSRYSPFFFFFSILWSSFFFFFIFIIC